MQTIMKKSFFVVLLFFVAMGTKGMAQTGSQGEFREDTVKNFILSWYNGTNEHVPKEQLLVFLSDEVEFRYPNRPEPLFGKPAFLDWYADVLVRFFDETHSVENWKLIEIKGDRAEVEVVVRWEYRTWKVGDAHSEYRANLTHQRWQIGRDAKDGRFYILKKFVEKFEPTAPIFEVGR